MRTVVEGGVVLVCLLIAILLEFYGHLTLYLVVGLVLACLHLMDLAHNLRGQSHRESDRQTALEAELRAWRAADPQGDNQTLGRLEEIVFGRTRRGQ